ncbi:MAG: glycosyltransferase [Actinomycetota bacterium]
MKKPLISVIVPVYNGEDYIAGSIEALLANNYPKDKFEIIIVDNGSVDSTEQIIKRYIKGLNPVKYIKELKCGAAQSRNTGASVAQGEILAFIDSDAFANKDWLMVIEETLADSNVDGVMGITLGINRNLWAEFFQRQYEEFFLADRMKERDRLSKIDTKNFALKKSVFSKVGGLNTAIASSEDVEYGLRLYFRGYRSILNEKMVVQHLNPTELERDIKTKRGQTFFHYRIALLYREARDDLRKKTGNDLFGPRYDHLVGFLVFRDRKFLRLQVTFLKFIFPPLILSLTLLLKLLHALGLRNKLYKLYLKTICFVTWHGGILSIGFEKGFFHVDLANDTKLFRRARKNE